MWSRNVMKQNKTVISPLLHNLYESKLAQTYQKIISTESYHSSLFSHLMSRDKLETFCLLYHKTYYQQTWQLGTKGEWLSTTNSFTFLTWTREVIWQIKKQFFSTSFKTYDQQAFKGCVLEWQAFSYQVILTLGYKMINCNWRIHRKILQDSRTIKLSCEETSIGKRDGTKSC